ncbi:hypothetical protein [Tabrizicola sp.]|uniref:hypothetical protein n=1 Tax=Tabrizicola sp. TaxID=2005166 RepID=UPI003F405638
MRLALLLCLIGSPSFAQDFMTPDEFDAWSVGKTLDYSVNGEVWGSETYLPGRKVLDADVGGPCVEGSWYAEGDAVCFVYPAREGVHCWRFWREGGQVMAQYLSATPDDPPQLVTVADGPLQCPGPDVGV